jgi:parallel beta-helix repeat protein
MRASTYVAVTLLLCITPLPAFSATYHITDDGSGDYPTIQAAITASAAGDTIVLADGTYTGAGNWDLDFGGKNIVVRSENGRMLCVIDCGDGLSGEHRAFRFQSGEDSTAVVDDITIQEGYVETMEGGGILIENGSSPTIRNCHIGDCRAVGDSPSDGHGGGIAIFDSSPRIIDNIIYSNSSIAGGGIYLEGSSAVIMGNDIYSNSASTGGGGIFSSESTPVIVNNWLDSNSGGGAAINNYVIPADDAIVHNNLFTHNIGPGEALLWGVQFPDVPSITSCTFFNNSGGGIYMNSSNGTVTDCILYTNGTTEIDADNASVTYCWVDGGYAGTGNITGTSISWDYGVYAEIYLPEGNECLDAGSAAASDICFDTQYGERCLNQMSALQSERPDTGQVDVGYHYIRTRTTLYVPDDVATIKGAIDASVDCDRIEV